MEITRAGASRNIAGSLQQRRDALLLKLASFHQLERFDARSFFCQRVRERRHAARRNAADVCMVTAARNEEDGFATNKDLL